MTAPVVAVLARLVEGKGVEYFLAAAAMVAASFPDARFLVVGDERARRAEAPPIAAGSRSGRPSWGWRDA